MKSSHSGSFSSVPKIAFLHEYSSSYSHGNTSLKYLMISFLCTRFPKLHHTKINFLQIAHPKYRNNINFFEITLRSLATLTTPPHLTTLTSEWIKDLTKKHECNFSLALFDPGGGGVADFPAVFFHISHWYLSWNTHSTHVLCLSVFVFVFVFADDEG